MTTASHDHWSTILTSSIVARLCVACEGYTTGVTVNDSDAIITTHFHERGTQLTDSTTTSL